MFNNFTRFVRRTKTLIMKKAYLTLVLISLVVAINAQNVWQQIYDQKRASTFTQTTDDKFVITGHVYESSKFNLSIFKTDAFGNIEWDTIIPQYGIPISIVATSDSGFIISYRESVLSSIASFIKFSSDNSVIWESNFDFGDNTCYINSVVVNEENMLVAIGHVYEGGTNSILLMKLDNNGDEVWTKFYEFANNNNRGRSIVNAYDGNGYYCLGSRSGTSNLLLRVNESGDTLWTKPIGNFNNYYPVEMTTTPDNSLIISVHNDMDTIGYLKTDSLGNELWERKYGTDSYNFCVSIADTYDNGLITANTVSNGGNYDLWIMKLDENGENLFSITPPFFPYNIHLSPKKIIQTEDGLFVFLATDENDTPRLVKTDSTGNIITATNELIEPDVKKLKCYPNPFVDKINIEFENSQIQNATLNVYNLNGKVVFSKNSFAGTRLTVNLNKLKTGMYLLELNVDGDKQTTLIEKK